MKSDLTTVTVWAEQFRVRNLKWAERRNLLAKDLLLFCGGSLLALEKGKNPEHKKRLIRRVKFAAFRLSVFYHSKAPALFRMLLSKPWILHPHICARALRHYQSGEFLREGLASTFALVRAKCAQELGHLAEKGARSELWSLGEHGTQEIVRLAATEGLLRMGCFTDEDHTSLLRCIRRENNPYVLKNFLLMLPLAQPPSWVVIAETAARRCPHQVVFDALVWAQSHPGENLLILPDIEPPYTRKTKYPDFELYPLYFDLSG
jgi:hypothetical protein